MGERIAVGDKLPFFVYDTPYSAQNRFRDLLQRKSPLVLVFMANFGHPITRTFASRYANTYGSLRDGGFALVVRSRADKLSRSIGPNTLPYPLLCDAEGVLYEHLDIPQSSSALMTYSLEGWRILREAKRQGYQAAKGQMQQLPLTLTSYSPCFRKEKGAHGIEERGVYRIHQFEKQEMIVVCKPEESPMWYDKLWQNTVDLFRSMDIPVRTLECCSGDLADLKVKSCDVEAWSPRQKKYFEVGSCSNLGDAQARRLKIRVQGEDGTKYLAHTLNNTVVAPPRMLIAFLENNLQADGSVRIPEVLRPYMGGMEAMVPKNNK